MAALKTKGVVVVLAANDGVRVPLTRHNAGTTPSADVPTPCGSLAVLCVVATSNNQLVVAGQAAAAFKKGVRGRLLRLKTQQIYRAAAWLHTLQTSTHPPGNTMHVGVACNCARGARDAVQPHLCALASLMTRPPWHHQAVVQGRSGEERRETRRGEERVRHRSWPRSLAAARG